MSFIDKIDPALLQQIPNLPIEEQKEILSLMEELEESEAKDKARETFMGFTNRMWPAFIEGLVIPNLSLLLIYCRHGF